MKQGKYCPFRAAGSVGNVNFFFVILVHWSDEYFYIKWNHGLLFATLQTFYQNNTFQSKTRLKLKLLMIFVNVT